MRKEPVLQDVQNTSKQITPFVHRTPVLTSQSVNSIIDGEVFFKCENFQKTGSFKMRGASNAVLSLSEEESKRGVVTVSSGNHGAALACAAKLNGIISRISRISRKFGNEKSHFKHFNSDKIIQKLMINHSQTLY